MEGPRGAVFRKKGKPGQTSHAALSLRRGPYKKEANALPFSRGKRDYGDGSSGGKNPRKKRRKKKGGERTRAYNKGRTVWSTSSPNWYNKEGSPITGYYLPEKEKRGGRNAATNSRSKLTRSNHGKRYNWANPNFNIFRGKETVR